MMKNLMTTALSVSAIALSFLTMRGDDALVRFDAFRISPDISLALPVLPSDSALKAKNAFSEDMLLKTVNRRLERVGDDWGSLTADTANMVRLPKTESMIRLNTLATRLRASGFVKGKIRLKSNVMAQLSAGLDPLVTVSASDSVASWNDASVSLEPYKTLDLWLTVISRPDDPASPELSLEFVPDSGFEDVEFASGAGVAKRFLIEESALGTRVNKVAVSPDGKYVIVRYYSFYGQDRSDWRAELRECVSGKVVNASIPVNAAWLDKGSTLYFTKKTDETYSLFTLDAASQKQQLLAEELSESNFTISPDASYLIYNKYVEGVKDEGPLKRILSPDDRLAGYRDRYYIEKYDLTTGIRQPLTYAGYSNFLYCISPDSRKIIYGTSVDRPDKFPFYFQDIMEMDVTTLKTDTLMRDATYITDIIYSPDGRQLFITGAPEAFDGIGKDNGGRKYSNDYDVQGFIFTIADRSVNPVTVSFDPAIEGSPVWNHADGNIYFRASAGFDLNVYCLDPRSGRISKIDFGMPCISSFSIGLDNARQIAASGGDFSYAGRAELLDLKSGKITLLDDPYSADFPDLVTGEMSPWSFKASDGTNIECMQVLPPDFDPERKYPMIVYYYGGCSPTQRSVSVYDPQIFASRGYVTLVINPSGAYGYGQEFSSRHANAWGKRTAEDIIEGVEQYCATHPFVDDSKIGCLGASYGGFMTQYLQTLTDKFAAAVSHAGISDVTSYWGEGNWGYSYNAIAAPESYPWNNPELFTRQGSLFNADKIHTPLLLLHGSVDTNVPVGESIQLFNALKILGREVEFIQVDGENHYISNYDKRKKWHAAIMAWFAKHLQDAPQWWEEMYPE